MLKSSRRIVLVAFDGVEALDITGPAGVFARANERVAGAYEVVLASPDGGLLRTQAGLHLGNATPLSQIEGRLDTVLVAGGDEASLRRAIFDDGVAAWLSEKAPSTRRIGSICTGAFILGAAGLLNGRRATTHWASAALLQTYFTQTRVDADAIYVIDGAVCTSAGVTAGLDLALALVADDLGKPIAASIAKDLVLFLHRPGGQAQFSATLAAQARTSDRLSELLAWMTDHPDGDLSVPALASRAAMSERTFARRFTREVGRTPLQFVLELRLDHAKRLLETTAWSLERIAARSGLGSVDTLHRLFRRHLGVTPSAFRDRFASAASKTPD
ncbi:HTH-type transcriptional regulator CdhR [Ensifer sp. M14]|uniref:GlxA family transcriptional regulator n=1 Tax=Ensifer sp. M14 TaxID=2203782 RepID=UPI000E1CAA22|nr:helix-turn-helix domain-containing protein [Ensifer sp. M14]RDL51473.1 HTH-type transcriptional regulator CdhR [Ensifer sp. M14]